MRLKNTYYIETMGCQMNKLDSELVINELDRAGLVQCDSIDEAGVIIFNTCSVRQHAEEKVLSKIGQLRKRHLHQKDFVLAIIGCMAERMGQELLDNWDQTAIVCGPNEIHRLLELIDKVRSEREAGAKPRQSRYLAMNTTHQADQDPLEELDSRHEHINPNLPFMSYVRVMRGCNYFCSYCIVPYVRGREQSRPLNHIIEESRRLAANGVKEITFLGQTVNSYHYEEDGKHFGLADILEAAHAIDGIERIRFVTSYPRQFDRRIFHLMASLPKVCSYLHIPAQSGSDRILKAMNRRYSAAEYLALIDEARSIVPDITIAGDFICGFPGETDADHQATRDLMLKVRYKNCFVFKYSPRPHTRAQEKMVDDVPDEIKQQRLADLLELQHQIALQDNQTFVGREVSVLVEGLSKSPHLNSDRPVETEDSSNPLPQLVGRTPGDHIVVFNGPASLTGQIVTTRIHKVSSLTFFGNEVRIKA